MVQLTLKENNQKTVCPDIARYPSTNAHASDLIEHKMKESILTQTVFTQFTITITIMFPFVILQWLWYICLIPMRMVTNHYTLWEENPSDSVFRYCSLCLNSAGNMYLIFEAFKTVPVK